MSDAQLRRVAVILAITGLGIAGYLTYVHYAGIESICEIAHGCEQVQASEWSRLAGVPVALLGLIGYAGILVSLVVPGEAGLIAAAAQALVGFGFSVYLTYREVFTIEAICIWCVASAIVLAALAVLNTVRLLRAEPAGGDHGRSPRT
ncbi:MAG: vitamin epoxide reductase family protein [Solirubrobacterales bacterium]|nr:vitamin epoxide reductase family protein [Solirubrobacterales bacterium]